MISIQIFFASQSRVEKDMPVATRMQHDICQHTTAMQYRTTHTTHDMLAHESF